MTGRTLTSSHVNYLVWRYLQESGYGDSARLLARDWDRNPESLPFSRSVRPQALVNVIQDGLWVDQLEAELRQTPRRYRFCTRYGLNTPIENGNTFNGINNTHFRDVQLSTSDSYRRDNASSENNDVSMQRRKRRVNGVDAHYNNNILSMHPEKGVVPASNEIVILHNDRLSEWEQQLATATRDIGRSIGVQCDKSADLTSHSVIFPIKTTINAVVHTKWSPVDPLTFLVASESRQEFYSVPSTIGSTAEASQINSYSSISNEPAMVTALTWISATDAVFAMWNEPVNIVEGDIASSKVVLLRSLGTEATVISSVMQVVFALRWHADTKRLLGVCGNGLNGAIWVWDAATSNTSHFLPIGSPVLDAAWIAGSLCCVCGQSFLRIYRVDSKLELHKSFSTKILWEQIRYDAIKQVITCISYEQNMLCFMKMDDTDIQTLDLSDGISVAMEIQPRPVAGSDTASFETIASSLLAIAFDSGIIQLRDAQQPYNVIRRLRMDVPVMAIAFSPDGYLLAAAGLDSVFVWSEGSGVIPQATWRAPANQWNIDGPSDDTEAGLSYSLSWNVDGQKLIYTVGNQVSKTLKYVCRYAEHGKLDPSLTLEGCGYLIR